MGYTKLFSDLVASSIWDEDDKTRIVWITMLALKDRNHFVRGTVHYLALASRMSDVDCGRALEKLQGPDEKRPGQEDEGRRIRKEGAGWVILNGQKYHKMLSKEERLEYQRVKQAEYRQRKKEHLTAAGGSAREQLYVKTLEEQGKEAAEATLGEPEDEMEVE